MRRLMLGTDRVMIPESTQCWKQLLGLCEVVTEVVRTAVGLCHLRRPIACRGKEGCPQSEKHVYFALDALRCLGERLEQRQPLAEMGDRFHMGGALDGALTCVMPIANRLCKESCFRTMVR